MIIFLHQFRQSHIFFNSSHDIDVLLLAVDPIDFFDNNSGIYVFGSEGTYDTSIYTSGKFLEDWERPIHLSFYEK